MLHRVTAVALAALCAGLLGGCSVAINPLAVQDAQTAVRVKTAIVNDPMIGERAIEVRVTNGVVRLEGAVASEAEAERAVAMARAVGGVVRVESALRTEEADPAAAGSGSGPQSGRPQANVESLAEIGADSAADRRLLAVGLSVGWNGPRAGPLQSAMRVGPLVRVGSGQGLGLTVGLGWFGADLSPDAPGDDTIGRLKIRPIMGGLSYTVRGLRRSVSFSLVAGPAFNGVALSDTINERQALIGVGNSFAWRPAVSVWLDVDSHTALNISGGYLMTRPRATFLEDGQISSRRLRANAVTVGVGMAYKLF